MTGRSSDLSDPQWQYDELGTACLDTIVDFIRENNPDGLTATQWKDLYWQRALGLEHTSWGNPILGLNCGLGARMSARDQARVGQLWLNKGAWPGLMPSSPASPEHTNISTRPEKTFSSALTMSQCTVIAIVLLPPVRISYESCELQQLLRLNPSYRSLVPQCGHTHHLKCL